MVRYLRNHQNEDGGCAVQGRRAAAAFVALPPLPAFTWAELSWGHECGVPSRRHVYSSSSCSFGVLACPTAQVWAAHRGHEHHVWHGAVLRHAAPAGRQPG